MMTTDHINLQQMAMISIGQCVWQTPPVKHRIKHVFSIEDENDHEVSRYLEWIRISREVYKKLKEDLLPIRLTSELLYVVKQMGDHMYDWYHYFERANKFLQDKCDHQLEYPEKIFWLVSGTIDVKRVIFENWIKNISLENACAVYFVSIIHGLDKHRTDAIWNLMPTKLKIICRQIFSCKESYSIAFLYAFISDPKQSLIIAKSLGFSTVEQRQRFLLFVSKGYIELVKNVWHQLNCSARNSIVDKGFRLALRRSSTFNNRRFEKKRYDRIALFLYCQMSDQHRYKMLREISLYHNVTKVLCIVASRPHLNLLMPVLDEVLRYILNDTDYIYSDLVNCLIYDMLEDFDCNYVPRGILVQVWKRLPVRIKRDIQFNEVFEGLIDEWDLSSLRIVLNIPEFFHEKEKFIETLVHCYIKSARAKEGSDNLNELAEKVFVHDSDIACFLRKVEDYKAMSLVESTSDD